jgi:DUF4097 and DUF4098 domain-containing protein YvlB
MKFSVTVASIVAALVVFDRPGAAGRDGQDLQARVTETFLRTVPISPTGSFTISNPSGNVFISGASDSVSVDAVRVEAVKRASGNNDLDARAQLQAIDIAITSGRGGVVVTTTMPERVSVLAEVDFIITVPPNVTVRVSTLVGDVRVSNVKGAVDASTMRGNLTASSLGNLQKATTVSGDLAIDDSQGDHILASTLSGDVTVNGLNAASIDVEVGNGRVSCAGVRATRAYLRTDSGDLEYSGPLLRSGLYQVQSRSGSVRFTTAGETGFRVDASSFRGNLRSEYPFPDASFTTGEGGVNRTLQGTFGDPSASITLRSLRGDVTLARQ